MHGGQLPGWHCKTQGWGQSVRTLVHGSPQENGDWREGAGFSVRPQKHLYFGSSGSMYTYWQPGHRHSKDCLSFCVGVLRWIHSCMHRKWKRRKQVAHDHTD